MTVQNQRPFASLTGVPLADCNRCSHRDTLLANGKCVPGDVCLIARSGRQIDRFLRRNSEFALACLTDDFWERRAIAARYAPLDEVQKMRWDNDEVVRRVVASRLPVARLGEYLRDTDREVRMTVAERIAPEKLNALISDPDYLVRLQVAKRLPHGQLPRMAHDPDREVRKEAARRMPPFALSLLGFDEDAEVRRIVAARMLPEDAAAMLADTDWLVRLEAAKHAPLEAVTRLPDDCEPDVCAVVQRRLNGFLFEDEHD